MQIVAIILIKNEDLFIRRVISNITDFCDRIIVADNLSQDGTREIVESLTAGNPKFEYHRINHPGISHELIKGFAGTDTWIFGVDGDEIYDPRGLTFMRPRLLAGEYSQWWQIFGNVFNCVTLDIQSGKARGHTAPPCRSMTKLFNFAAIESWEEDSPERLHGTGMVFKSGYNAGLRLGLLNNLPWEQAFFRCLHLCFIPRSSLENAADPGQISTRLNISELNLGGVRIWLSRFLRKHFMRRVDVSSYKRERYMRGDVVETDISPFF